MTEREAQTQQILRYLEAGNSITGLEALTLFGCMRLPARIADLKKAGVPIVDNEWECQTDDNGKIIKRWKRYRLARGEGTRNG